MGNSKSRQSPQPSPTNRPNSTSANQESSEALTKINDHDRAKTIQVDKETEKQNKGLLMKNSCQVKNFCEVPIRVFAISHADFLQKIQKKFKKEGSFSIVSMRSSKYKGKVREYSLQEYYKSRNKNNKPPKPSDCLINLKGKWVVLAIYIDVDFEDHFTLWRIIEGKNGLQVNVRNDHIDEAELADDQGVPYVHDEVTEPLPADAVDFIKQLSKRGKPGNDVQNKISED